MTKKVILADDKEIIRVTVRDLFLFIASNTGLDVEFDTVENGRELVERVLANGYDLAITDQSMPKLVGSKACQQIREANPVIPVYMHTDDQTDIARQYAAYGATGYIKKGGDLAPRLEMLMDLHLRQGLTHQDM